MPHELVHHARGVRETFRLEREFVRVGRAADNDLVVADNSISRYHAELRREGKRYRVRDLGSTNGTRVNGAEIEGDAVLRDGDDVTFGSVSMTYAGPRGIELTALEEASVSGESVVFREAVDFSVLAAEPGPRRRATKTEDVRIGRLQKLVGMVTQTSETLLRSQDQDGTLDDVVDLVFEHLPAERVAVMLWDEGEKRLRAASVKDRSADQEQGASIKFSRTIAEKVVQEKVGVLTSDAQSDPRFRDGASVLDLGIRSAMAAPLWRREKVEGLIYCDTPLRVKAFDSFDLDLLSALGNLVAVALERNRLRDSVLEERLSRQRLERYHSPAVVERIKQLSSSDMLVAEEREVTVLFADIVGFTERCEVMEPREVAEMLNRCFSRMSAIVFRYEGTLDKYIGDCLMAVFGAPLEQPDHAARAVEAVLDMQAAIDSLNEELPEPERAGFRAGLNTGRVVAGDIGSVLRSDFTVLGATVNLASRMQSSVAKPGQIVVSDTTFESVKDRFRFEFAGRFQPKGISRRVSAYRVVGRR